MTIRDHNGNKSQLQQGDVLLMRVSSIPKSAKAVAPGEKGVILAEGETHNHHHAIKDVEHAIAYEINGDLYLEVSAPVVLTHEEHGPIEIPEGIYEIGKVLEKDHLTRIVRPVAD